MNRYIDQFLFTNIVRQSYEVHKAEQECFSKYIEQSENERNFYKFFSSKTRLTIDEDNKDTKILDYWYNVIDNKEEYNRWERLYKDKIRLDRMFIDVESFLMMFSHHR
jgi:hypothetical protein